MNNYLEALNDVKEITLHYIVSIGKSSNCEDLSNGFSFALTEAKKIAEKYELNGEDTNLLELQAMDIISANW